MLLIVDVFAVETTRLTRGSEEVLLSRSTVSFLAAKDALTLRRLGTKSPAGGFCITSRWPVYDAF